MAFFARGHLPGSSGYIQTANNTNANGHDTDLQHGACGSQSECQTTDDPTIAGDSGCKSKVFSYGQTDDNTDTTDNIHPTAESVYDDVNTNTQNNVNPIVESICDDVNTDNPDNVQPRTESENSIQLSESVTRWGNVNRLPENQGTLPSMGFSLKETIHEKHQKRLKTRKEDCGNCKDGFHPTLSHDLSSHQAGEEVVLQQCQQKIGLIQCQICGDRGTCFRVGKYNIVTCHHVTRPCTKHRITAVFRCQGQDQHDTWVYEVKEEEVDPELDYVIYKLLDNGNGFPPAFPKFRASTPNDGRSEDLTYIVCFQQDSKGESRLEVHGDTVRLNSNTFDKYRCYSVNLTVMRMYPNKTRVCLPYDHADLHRQSGNIPLLCKVIHGGSGGVGVYLDENGTPVVDFMYRRGYPGFFYATNTDRSLTTEQKKKFPGCLLVEVAIDIQTMIQKSNKELWTCED